MSNDTFPHSRKTGASIPGMLLAIPVLLLILLILAIGFYEARKAYWDYQVRELCAKDGGIRVYETVKFPPEKFNEWGQVNFYKPTLEERALGENYQLRTNTVYYRKDNPQMSRSHIQIIREADQKLLGESISYGRGGGDMPGPWHGSSYNCPSIEYGYIELFKNIFVIDRGEIK